ncbi:MAG: GlsB/YeaQ/YmgE family stress response membrane protein [Rubricoccaceae bacterium]|nr:GlsB/YeaQ/YmgE family stress response membrane protein [Rubricoccaceae bacterium]
MGLLAWIVIGIIAGFVAEQVTKTSMGLLMNLLVGVIGAFVGGFIVGLLGQEGVTGFNLWSLVVATIGAIVLLLIVNAVRRNT